MNRTAARGRACSSVSAQRAKPIGKRTRHGIAAVALLAALAAGCATSPTGRSQLMLVSDAQMSQMGLTAFANMRKAGKFAHAPRERAYATCVADALIQVLPRPWRERTWDVEIIADDSANAFALPGGRIGVNQGMFKVATNQDQLAVVLGHELSHVVARHAAERVSDNLAVKLGATAASAYGATRGIDPDLTMAALGIGSEVGILLPFSRTQESEADRLGLRYMAEAGFDPRVAASLWHKMAAQSGAHGPTFLSTHPSSAKRAATLGKLAKTLMPLREQARNAGRVPHCRL